ncbi:hypothetical protein PPTG_08296 [Phytophthora nicotianae INRA-310]|uniref:Uncharacterized protein n=1 Tax=Phytophthora nicotianae (strain INRA-310) TaxID=761204 RepID=W2QLS6_PHYN3|nr:hypothetical protein PPTG_08296 [Phytophthora nicotianae INRA-310]ETN13479.1 hypothetical protein PPTG_08296 [Phytophthora nicotianae INRA-310]
MPTTAAGLENSYRIRGCNSVQYSTVQFCVCLISSSLKTLQGGHVRLWWIRPPPGPPPSQKLVTASELLKLDENQRTESKLAVEMVQYRGLVMFSAAGTAHKVNLRRATRQREANHVHWLPPVARSHPRVHIQIGNPTSAETTQRQLVCNTLKSPMAR